MRRAESVLRHEADEGGGVVALDTLGDDDLAGGHVHGGEDGDRRTLPHDQQPCARDGWHPDVVGSPVVTTHAAIRAFVTL
jgi:hypothetical protein